MFIKKQIVIFIGIIGFLAVFFVFLYNFIFEIPYDAIVTPKLLDNDSFYTEIEVECNNYLKRELGFRVVPPISIVSIAEAHSAVSGDVKVVIIQDNMKKEYFIELSNTGSYVNSVGIWSKVIMRFEPIGSFFCSDQKIIIEANNLNFNLMEHSVNIYVSRDRRL